MIANKAELIDAARSLSPDDRRDVIAALMHSLRHEENVRDEWIDVCQSRLAAYDRGESQAIPLVDVFPELSSGRL